MDRRAFHKLCSSLMAGASSLSLASPGGARTADGSQPHFPLTALLDQSGNPVTEDSLQVGSSHIFNYPFVTTPCFLLRLQADKARKGKAETTTLVDKNGVSYPWAGGIGKEQAIVAFSAICTHKMSHPAKPISHLNFRDEEKIFFDRDGKKSRQSQLIYCCSEHSAYDPAQGARVLSGPATQPLAAIELQLNAKNEILAVGSYGGNMYETFLEKFGFRQAMEQNVSDPATLAGENTRITPAESYSRQQVLC